MRALIVVDIQNDFLPNGALAVKGGDEIIPLINQLSPKYPLVVATQDWHPADHQSFASQHAGTRPGQLMEVNGLNQVLWPDHCVQGSEGAAFSSAFDLRPVAAIFRKGMNRQIDSYSAFFDNGYRQSTGLDSYLRAWGITDIDFAGLATDYCVYFSALDGLMSGFNCRLLLPACRGVNVNPHDSADRVERLRNLHCQIIEDCAGMAL